MPTKTPSEETWYQLLTEGEPTMRHGRHLLGMLPSSPRCKMCNAPFRGVGGFAMRVMGRQQSRYNPRYCMVCSKFGNPGGAEIVLTLFFADVRGSTTLAERMSALEFTRLMNRFYSVATDVLVQSDAVVEKFVGDEVVGLYIPGMAGPEHPRRAIQAAERLLELTGHRESQGPWLPVGIGVHTGPAYVGVVGGAMGDPKDFTALGDSVNVTARLASRAGAGEILISDAAYEAAGLGLGEPERRELELKGRSESFGVRVVRIAEG
jgi:adenylate cyclase